MEAAQVNLRAFAAINLPAACRTHLAEVLHLLKAELSGPAFRWARPDQVHLTLRFFGDVTWETAHEISARLESLAPETRPFHLKFGEMGAFPQPCRARVLWIGLGGDEDALHRLHARVNQATGNLGLPPEHRAFRPHLTLARIQAPTRLESTALSRILSDPSSIPRLVDPWSVDLIHLMRSHLGGRGARYEVVSAHSLRGGSP